MERNSHNSTNSSKSNEINKLQNTKEDFNMNITNNNHTAYLNTYPSSTNLSSIDDKVKNIKLSDVNKDSNCSSSVSSSQLPSPTNLQELHNHNSSQTFNSNSSSGQNNVNENLSNFRSCDFNSKEFDEKLEIPINVRNLESNNLLHSSSLSQIPTNNQIHLAHHVNSIPPHNSINLIHEPSLDFEFSTSTMKNTIHLKTNLITNLNYFLQNYVNDIQNVFSKLDAIVYKKVTAILDKHKYFLRFFKEITTLYETFSINLLQANNTINLHFKDEDESGPFGVVNSTIDKSQELISNSFYDFSKNLQNKLIIKGPLANVKEFYNKMSHISKDSTLILSEITRKRDKLVQKFQNFEKIFESFKKSFHDTEKLNPLLMKNEFFLIEFEFCNSVNKLFIKIEQFFNKYKRCLTDLKDLTKDFINSLKEGIDTYVFESKKMFLIEEMDNALDSMKIKFEALSENSKDILLTDSGNKIINDALKVFQTNLLKFTFVKNEKIYNDELFLVDNYHNYEEMIDFLYSILPEKINLMNSSLIVFSCEVKKIYGLFSSARPCVLLITVQNSVLIFEEKVNKKAYEKFNRKNLKFKNLEDKRHPYRFELQELKYGLIYNSTLKMTLEVENQEIYNRLESFLIIK
jgi:hypothetical protein